MGPRLRGDDAEESIVRREINHAGEHHPLNTTSGREKNAYIAS
jgi:hypothetical protein